MIERVAEWIYEGLNQIQILGGEAEDLLAAQVYLRRIAQGEVVEDGQQPPGTPPITNEEKAICKWIREKLDEITIRGIHARQVVIAQEFCKKLEDKDLWLVE